MVRAAEEPCGQAGASMVVVEEVRVRVRSKRGCTAGRAMPGESSQTLRVPSLPCAPCRPKEPDAESDRGAVMLFSSWA